MPVRDLVFHAKKERGLEVSGFDGSNPLLLVFGGSLGAEFLNKLTRDNIRNKNLDSYSVINICGKGQLDEGIKQPNYVQFESLGDDFLHIMEAADLVITRGGATSLFELLAMKKLHIVIPLSKKVSPTKDMIEKSKKVSRGDQIDNAGYFADLGVSSFIEEKDCSWAKIYQRMKSTMENKAPTLSKIEEMEFANATQKVLNVINAVVK